MASIADVYVTVIPETSKIKEGVRKAFREVDSDAREAGRRWGGEIRRGMGDVGVKIDGDTKPAERKIDELTKRPYQATVKVDVDPASVNRTSAAMATMWTASSAQSSAAAERAMDRIANAGQRVRAVERDLGETRKQGATLAKEIEAAEKDLATLRSVEHPRAVALTIQAERQLQALRERAERTNSRLVRQSETLASVQRAEASAVRGATRARQEAAQAAQRAALGSDTAGADRGRIGRTELIAGAVGVGGVLSPNMIAGVAGAVAQLSGVVGLLPAVVGTAGLAFGSLKIATLGFADALKEVRDPEKFAEAIGQISPNMQQAATAIQGLLPQIDQLKFTVQDAFGAGLGNSIQQLGTTYLPMFQTVMSQMASSASTALKDVGNMLMEPARQADMGAMTNNMAVAFDKLSQALTPVVSAFVDIGLVGSGFMPQLADAATRAAQAFSDFIGEARASGELQGWINTGIEALKQLGRIAGDVFGIIGGIMKAAPEGGGLLGTLEKMTQIVNDFVNSPAGQQALNTWMSSVQSAMVALTPAVSALLQALAPLASVIGQTLSGAIQAIAPALTTWFTAMQPVIQQLAGALLPVIQQVMPVIAQLAMVLANQMVTGIQQILPALVPFVGQMGQLLVAILPLLPPMLQLVTGALPMMQQVVAMVLPPLTQFATILTNLANLVVPPLTAAVGALADSFSSRFTVISGVVSTVWNSIQGPLSAMKAAIEALTAPLQIFMELASRIPGVSSTVSSLTVPTALPTILPSGAGQFGGANAQRERRGSAPVAAATGVPMTTLPVPGVSTYVAPVIPSGSSGGSGSVPAGALPAQYEQGMVPNNVQLLSILEQKFPGVTAHADANRNDKYGEHGSGEALDIMVGANAALGSQINEFLLQNADALGLQYNIWQQQMWRPGSGPTAMEDRGSPTQNHMDHVHARVKPGAATGASSQMLSSMPADAYGSPLSSAYPSSDYAATGDPAFDRKSRDAQQKVADKADAATRAQMKYDQVMANGKATALQRKTAEDALAKAKREHADAQTDLNTLLEKGNSLEGKGAGGSGGEQLGGDIMSGIGEIFGLGGLFKDPTQFGLFKIVKAMMGLSISDEGGQTAGGGGLFGGAGGGGGGGLLGGLAGLVQKPFGDMTIGSPKDAPGQFMPKLGNGGGGTGGGLPPMLAKQGGAPGPGNQIDQSVHINGNVGYSASAVQKQVNGAHLQQSRQPLRALPG